MKEEKVYNVRYSESKGKIKLYLEPKKLVFKKTKGLFKKETIIVDTVLLDDIKTKRNEVNLDIDYNEVCIETKDKFILITFDEIKDVDKFVKELKEAIKKRKKIIVPDSAHGTNPASAAMAGFQVVSIESAPDGGVDLEKLQEVCGEDTAGLMLTNPNTVGLFDKNILKITEIVHNCGGLCYYDGANLNAVMGTVRPGDMGFDVIHLNLHKTFSTPHGGGGPGSGPVGCKSMLVPFLPSYVVDGEEELKFVKEPQSIGEMKSFYGNFTVIVKALTYVKTLGREGIPEASQNAVLNANYMMNKLKDLYTMAYDEVCMHEFVMSLADLKKKTGISAMDIAKGLLDNGIHPPTMYFPLIVEEALMVEPTETESKETLDEAVEVLRKLYEIAETDAEQLHQAPVTTPVTRMDEVGAARHPYLRYEWQD